MPYTYIQERLKNAKILIVDDIQENVQLMANVLQNEGYFVLVATSGEQALKIAENKKPDLILLDIQMPVMDGFTVIKILKEEKKILIPVIFLTARNSTEDIVNGFSSGAVDYITKPINTYELLARIKNHLSLKLMFDLIIEQNEFLNKKNDELEAAYKKLQEEQQKVIDMEKIKSILAMAVTTNHELNQPLTVIQGNVEMLAIKYEQLTNDKHIKKIIESIDSIIDKMNKFASFDKITFKKYLDNIDMVEFNNDQRD